MTKNVSYKECTCDICGKVEHIPQSLILPKEWENFKLGQKSYDVCLDCFIKIDMAIEDIKDSYLRGERL